MRASILLKFIFSLCFCWSTIGFAGGRTGTGGETLSMFVNASGIALMNTARYIEDQKYPRTLLAPHCAEASKDITEEQARFCEEFIFAVIGPIRKLYKSKLDRTLFLPWEDPTCKEIIVQGAKPYWPLQAKTDLGADGPICFNHESLGGTTPSQLLALLTHEFGHKVPFEGNFIADKDPIGPFESGRELLNTVGVALAKLAYARNIINSKFVMVDSFECTVLNEGVNPESLETHLMMNVRHYPVDADLDQYETGVGAHDLEHSISFRPPNGYRKFFRLRLFIHEEYDCANHDEGKSTRYSRFDLLEKDRRGDWNVTSSSGKINRNPLCEQGVPLTFEAQSTKFSCRYLKSNPL